MPQLRVLCIDIEGGSGGSSRSLFEFMRYMDRERATVEVWCRRPSALVERYRALGIECRVEPAIPTYSALARFSRNLYAAGRTLWALWRQRKQLQHLADEIEDRFDLVHFNHEGLFLFGRWLRRRVTTPFTLHVRTMCWTYGCAFGRWQAKAISATTGACVFISENERDAFAAAGGDPAGPVVFNPVHLPTRPPAPDPRIPQDGHFWVASLSNFAALRGTDRLAEIAGVLAARGRDDIRFAMAGRMTLDRGLGGAVGNAARRGLSFEDHVAELGLSERFLFLDHVAEPERVLAACDLLIKPTREANPWGRDILEALAAGKPALSFGRYDRFLEDDATGILLEDYSVDAVADAIAALADDPVRTRRLGAAGRKRVGTLCNGRARAHDLAAFWNETAATRELAESRPKLLGEIAS